MLGSDWFDSLLNGLRVSEVEILPFVPDGVIAPVISRAAEMGFTLVSRRPGTEASDEARERDRRRYDIVEQAAPLEGEVVLRKGAPSAFFATPLVGHLVAQRIDTLIVCGQSASGCVRATVVDGRSHRFRMIVVEECVYDCHESSLAMSLFDLDERYADVLGIDAVVEWMRNTRPAA